MYLTLGVFFTGILLLPRSPLDRLLYGLPGGDPGTEAGYTLPSGLYMDMGMVMMPKTGVPRDGAMGGSKGSTSATKSDAGVKLRVPTFSRTSSAARIVGRVATALQPYPTLRPARPNSGTTRAGLPCPPRALPRP